MGTEVTLPPLGKHNSRNVLKLSWLPSLANTTNFILELPLAFSFAAVFNHVHFNWFFSRSGYITRCGRLCYLRFLLAAFALRTSWLAFLEREPARNGGTNLWGFFLSILTVVTIFRELKKSGCVDVSETVFVWIFGSIVACLSWVKLVSPWELRGTPSSTDRAKNINLLPFWVAMNQLSGLESGLENVYKWLMEPFVTLKLLSGLQEKRQVFFGVFFFKAEIRFAGHGTFKYGVAVRDAMSYFVMFRPGFFLQKDSTLSIVNAFERRKHTNI